MQPLRVLFNRLRAFRLAESCVDWLIDRWVHGSMFWWVDGSMRGPWRGLGGSWDALVRPGVVPGVILRTGGAHFSGLEGFGGIFGHPVGSKSDPGERLSRFGGPKGAKSEPKGDKN